MSIKRYEVSVGEIYAKVVCKEKKKKLSLIHVLNDFIVTGAC